MHTYINFPPYLHWGKNAPATDNIYILNMGTWHLWINIHRFIYLQPLASKLASIKPTASPFPVLAFCLFMQTTNDTTTNPLSLCHSLINPGRVQGIYTVQVYTATVFVLKKRQQRNKYVNRMLCYISLLKFSPKKSRNSHPHSSCAHVCACICVCETEKTSRDKWVHDVCVSGKKYASLCVGMHSIHFHILLEAVVLATRGRATEGGRMSVLPPQDYVKPLRLRLIIETIKIHRKFSQTSGDCRKIRPNWWRCDDGGV